MRRALVILFSSFIIASPFVCLGGAPATTQAVEDTKEMEGFWADLQKGDPWSSRALLDLYDRPVRTVAFLKEHLKPLKIEQKELDDLLDALGSEDEKVWMPAFEKLSYFDPRLNTGIETLMASTEGTVRRNHLVEILSDYPPDKLKGRTLSFTRAFNSNIFDFHDDNLHSTWYAESKVSELGAGDPFAPKREWTRADRAIVLLQHIGTPGAIAILKDMATGHPDAQPTKVAKAALESLDKAQHD